MAEGANEVLVALSKSGDGSRERALVALAADLVREDDDRRADGGQPSQPDLVVRRGDGTAIRDALLESRPALPSPGCTTVTGYPQQSRKAGFARRPVEQITF